MSNSKKNITLTNYLYQKNKINTSQDRLMFPITANTKTEHPQYKNKSQEINISTTKNIENISTTKNIENISTTKNIENINTIITDIDNLYNILNNLTKKLDLLIEKNEKDEKDEKNIICSPSSNTVIELSSLYLININTLYLEYSPLSNTYLIILREDMINHLVIKNFPINKNGLYKFKVYIKREPYNSILSYINIENLELQSINENIEKKIISLNNFGVSGRCIKPSVNSSFIIQEFEILFYDKVIGFQTITEY